ncbi:MAG TPA: PorV/PorQ family protein [Candidatus Krumholzibacteria bacterium]|nr:PorV/PorQ family protein [Candidatus Krumholzibacteria bacterium]HPD71858.1 PorV/PorQ family protein [Candidatus Krumholzibacteria bacterium]HRY41209.1 PorV/PorQ family protein [Candidatus Krumholzibacteria bacterium]
MVTRRGAAVFWAAVLGIAAAAHAGDTLRLYGEENVGTASGQFLKIPVGARPIGLGRAYVACASDGPVAFWNPAGLLRTPGLHGAFVNHTEWAADIDLDHAAYQWRTQNFGYAVSAAMLRSGEIPRTTEMHVEGTGDTFRADQYLLGFSLARAMTDRFSIGATVKYFQENLDEWETRAVLFDLGILYLVGVGDLSVGFSVRNFGPELQPGGAPPARDGYDVQSEFQKHPAPTEGSFGVAYTWDLARRVDLLTTADFNHPSDAKESFRMGGELGLGRILYLRAGFETGRDEGGLGAGFGLQLRRKQLLWRVDYGYSDLGSFGGMHYVSLEFSPLWDKERIRHGRVR